MSRPKKRRRKGPAGPDHLVKSLVRLSRGTGLFVFQPDPTRIEFLSKADGRLVAAWLVRSRTCRVPGGEDLHGVSPFAALDAAAAFERRNRAKAREMTRQQTTS